MTATTHPSESITAGVPTLLLAFDLGASSWKLGFTSTLGQPPRIRSIRARALDDLLQEIAAAKKRLGLPANAPVVSCYEAGPDGFWLHRWLSSQGVHNRVVDSSSIEVNRRARRAKTDRLDVRKLLELLRRSLAGEKPWSVVRVPSVAEEDGRQLHRELETLKHDRTRVTNRVHSLLATQGVVLSLAPELTVVALGQRLERARVWDGQPIPAALQARLLREWDAVVLATTRIAQLERDRRAQLGAAATPAMEQVQALMDLRGIGENSAWLWVMEFFAWRNFRNRREVGGLSGLTGTPWASGDRQHDQGISRAGNRRVRAMAVEIAWLWLRFQPQSALSQWYQHRFAGGGSRLRRIGIVAMARKLLIELWRYLQSGVIPEGAVLKGAISESAAR
jgi:transposase